MYLPIRRYIKKMKNTVFFIFLCVFHFHFIVFFIFFMLLIHLLSCVLKLISELHDFIEKERERESSQTVHISTSVLHKGQGCCQLAHTTNSVVMTLHTITSLATGFSLTASVGIRLCLVRHRLVSSYCYYWSLCIALFSALKPIHCAHVPCESKWSGVLTACLVFAWIVPRETADVSAQVLCTPYNHVSVYSVTSFKST